MNRTIKFAMLLATLLCAAALLAQSDNQPKPGDDKNAVKTEKPAETVADTGAPADYVIGADDVLHI